MDEVKVAIITGASRGIGRATAQALAAAGHYVIINFRNQSDEAEQTLALVRQQGGEGEIARFDVADPDASGSALRGIIKRFKHIEVLVNNAGVTADGLFALMPAHDWRVVMSTTLDGFYNVTKPVLKRMIANRKGSVVTLSSVAGLMGNRGQSNYAAAKAGVIGASRSLATEVARLGIRVNVVAPGLIDTDMTKDLPLDELKKLIPMRRTGTADEVARVIRFLCSDDASYVTGQVISVNGGMM